MKSVKIVFFVNPSHDYVELRVQNENVLLMWSEFMLNVEFLSLEPNKNDFCPNFWGVGGQVKTKS